MKSLSERRDELATEYEKDCWRLASYSEPSDAKSFAKGFDAALAEVMQAIEHVKTCYPPDIFPEDSDTIDARAARIVRLTCDNIVAQIHGGGVI